ncbi:multiple epidermal growth factor-like domains protein 10 [Haliotis rubra]|uniref:multiple epidermal growth factor-like domains protein 10 n=1 Tax=Haliotis rubra TaxID=36100 RepID=UPI001EE50993|nr:multiple epidermal growth factor-like domains protein 10 [Haliotis rubra]
MDWLNILCLMCSHIATQAEISSTLPPVSCKDNQHCSDCDGAGICLECTVGYFGRRCDAFCSENCLNKKCTESGNGNVNCTDGCVPGHQGAGCNIPCDSQGGNCTACPGGCDGGYCQLGSSCVSGCVHSYYGTGCKSCSSRCKICNRSTGRCTECQSPFDGQNCGCENCHGSGDCEKGDCENDPQGNGGQTRRTLTGLLVSLLLLVSGILVTLCLLYYKRLSKQREQAEQREQMRQDEVEYLEYLPSVQRDTLDTNRPSNHAYYDVVDGERRPAIVFH